MTAAQRFRHWLLADCLHLTPYNPRFRDAADEVTAHFRIVLGGHVPLRVATAVWTGAVADKIARQVALYAVVSGVVFYLPVWAGVRVIWDLGIAGKLQFPFPDEASRVGWAGEYFASVICSTIAGVIVAPFFTLKMGSGLSWQTSADEERWTLKRNRVPFLCAQLIRCCGQVRPSSTRHRKVLLRRIDEAADNLVRELMRLSRDRGLYPRRSPRRQAVRSHVAYVAAALRRKTLELDTEPDRALYELSQMSLKICTAYVGRRWGCLLEESELSGLEPFRRRETLRITVALIITLAAAFGAAAVGTPSALLPLVIGAVGVLAFTVVVGRTPQALALLDSMRGVQRP